MEEYGLRMLENTVLRRTHEPKREAVKRSLRKLHNEKLHNLYSFKNTARVIKSRKIGWAEHGRNKIFTQNFIHKT
jgi:hypothetical protein